MNLNQLLSISQLANALALASLLIVLSSGLALIFGLRGVMNFAHGAMYMLGAYLGFSISGVLNFWFALVFVPLIMSFFGAAFELGMLRPLQRRTPMDVAIVTFGISLIIGPLVHQVWGTVPTFIDPPLILSGSTRLMNELYPDYRLFLIAVGFSTCVGLAVWLKYTITGLAIRASIEQPYEAKLMGIDTDKLSLLVVCLSAALCGLAGVLAGPYLSVDPGMGNTILISCLIVVVVGGLGSISGAVVAAIIYGFIQVIGTVLFPSIAVLTPFMLLFFVLIWRPQGLGTGRIT